MRKVAVFTATRAEYGLLYWLMKDIQADPDLELQLIVSGTHLALVLQKAWALALLALLILWID